MGDVFAGRYELVDPLGEGGVGTVWRAWDHKKQSYCAAKVLRQVDATSLLRFIREQSLRLDHPHVLAPTGWAGEDDKVLFTMPMIRGGSVSTLVGDFGPLQPRLTALLLDQLLAALETIHHEGLVHRDVKPANLLLDATGREKPQLWLGDFGIAAGIDEPRLTQGPYALGTPGYLAPECLHHGWDPDPRADLYSAGMCAVEMILGVRPEAEMEVAEPLVREGTPQSLVNVVTQLTATHLTARTQTASEARRALEQTGLLAGEADLDEILGDVEVFDQIPELPEGWSEDGPTGTNSNPQVLVTPTSSTSSAGSAGSPPAATSAPTSENRQQGGPEPHAQPQSWDVPTQAAAQTPEHAASEQTASGQAPPERARSEQTHSEQTNTGYTDVVGVRYSPTVPVNYGSPATPTPGVPQHSTDQNAQKTGYTDYSRQYPPSAYSPPAADQQYPASPAYSAYSAHTGEQRLHSSSYSSSSSHARESGKGKLVGLAVALICGGLFFMLFALWLILG